MRLFVLYRDEDETGISGTGTVAEGAQFDDGSAVMKWIVGEFRSTALYPSMEAIVAIHGHNGRTRVVWVES